MALTIQLTQHKLKEILIQIYTKGMETKNIHVEDLVEDIKRQVLDNSK
ncbi:hypothetical protein AA0X95_08405 [Bacillus sp. 1P10SD]